MVHMDNSAENSDHETDVTTSPNDVITSHRDVIKPEVDEEEEAKNAAVYLESHVGNSSEKACEILRSVVEDTVLELNQRAALLETGIQERRDRVIQSLKRRPSVDLASTGNTTMSDLFKLMDRRNSVKLTNGHSKLVDYKEFMFFDRDSARPLNYCIKTLGDPSFTVNYIRDYHAIALNPEVFGSPGRQLGQFHGPSSVATDSSNNMYVCDSMNCRIVVFSDHINPLYSVGQKGTGDTDFDRPSSVAVDEVGQMYVADSFNDRVCVYSTEGAWKFNVGGRGDLNKPRGIACSKNGEIFVVSDTGNQRILVYSNDGTYKGQFGQLGMKEGQFVRPQGIKISGDKVYVSDSFNYRVQIFDLEGTPLGSMGDQGPEAGQFEEPRDIAVDSCGNVLVTDTVKNTLQIFDKDGNFVREYGSKGKNMHQFDAPEGVHTDEINRIFIADRKNDRIHIL